MSVKLGSPVLLERDWIAVQEEEQVKITKPKIGIMVEVPSVLSKLVSLLSWSTSFQLVPMINPIFIGG